MVRNTKRKRCSHVSDRKPATKPRGTTEEDSEGFEYMSKIEFLNQAKGQDESEAAEIAALRAWHTIIDGKNTMFRLDEEKDENGAVVVHYRVKVPPASF